MGNKSIMKNENETRGGANRGQGRKGLFGENETTKRIMISIPKSKETEVRKKILKILKAYIPKPSK